MILLMCWLYNLMQHPVSMLILVWWGLWHQHFLPDLSGYGVFVRNWDGGGGGDCFVVVVFLQDLREVFGMQLLFCECTVLRDVQAIDFGGGQEQFENSDQVFSVLFCSPQRFVCKHSSVRCYLVSSNIAACIHLYPRLPLQGQVCKHSSVWCYLVSSNIAACIHLYPRLPLQGQVCRHSSVRCYLVLSNRVCTHLYVS